MRISDWSSDVCSSDLQVMDVVCQDSKLNLSDYYMRPGFAFGGSCLPKDVRALTYRATQMDVDIPLLKSLMATNTMQVRNAFDLVESFGKRTIGMQIGRAHV